MCITSTYWGAILYTSVYCPNTHSVNPFYTVMCTCICSY